MDHVNTRPFAFLHIIGKERDSKIAFLRVIGKESDYKIALFHILGKESEYKIAFLTDFKTFITTPQISTL